MIHLRLIHAACWGAVLSCFGSPLARGDEPNAPAAQPPAPVAPAVQTFLGKYCTGCHGEKQAKGERRFHQLPQSIASDDSLVDFQGILDQLNLGEMPPPKAAQPTAQQRRQVIAAVTKAIAGYRATRKPVKGETVLRRLNAREYRHTIRDLFRLNTVIFDPTQTFPRDQTAAHLDNVGDELVTSGYLLQQYLSAAEQVVDRAVYPLEPPPIEKWSFRNGFRQQPEIDQVHRHTNRFEHMTLYEVRGADKHEGAYGHIREFAKGVPYDGFYTIRFHAEALNREHPYDPQFLGTDPSEPLRLGIVAGHQRVGQLHKPQPIEPLLEELELADEAKWYTTRVWLDAGYTPRFTYENGTMEMRSLYARILRKHPKLFPKPSRRGIVANRYTVLKFGKLPQIRIYEFEIEGPFYDRWPRASQRAVFGDNWEVVQETGELPDDRVRAQLSSFLASAYRRPARDEEIDRIAKLIAIRRGGGRSSVDAYADGLKAALCSPSFLYLEERGDQRLDSYSLATRLSYFLSG
ncbi:MAG: DUF1587 domain-containing protein, partial [Pirellulaceae bacterium]|nr:DUF1587 domain-containing protein [Pirellulaceae bacterium]